MDRVGELQAHAAIGWDRPVERVDRQPGEVVRRRRAVAQAGSAVVLEHEAADRRRERDRQAGVAVDRDALASGRLQAVGGGRRTHLDDRRERRAQRDVAEREPSRQERPARDGVEAVHALLDVAAQEAPRDAIVVARPRVDVLVAHGEPEHPPPAGVDEQRERVGPRAHLDERVVGLLARDRARPHRRDLLRLGGDAVHEVGERLERLGIEVLVGEQARLREIRLLLRRAERLIERAQRELQVLRDELGARPSRVLLRGIAQILEADVQRGREDRAVDEHLIDVAVLEAGRLHARRVGQGLRVDGLALAQRDRQGGRQAGADLDDAVGLGQLDVVDRAPARAGRDTDRGERVRGRRPGGRCPVGGRACGLLRPVGRLVGQRRHGARTVGLAQPDLAEGELQAQDAVQRLQLGGRELPAAQLLAALRLAPLDIPAVDRPAGGRGRRPHDVDAVGLGLIAARDRGNDEPGAHRRSPGSSDLDIPTLSYTLASARHYYGQTRPFGGIRRTDAGARRERRSGSRLRRVVVPLPRSEAVGTEDAVIEL